MGVMKTAFNAACRFNSRAMIYKRLASPGSPALFSPTRATPSNYFRYLAGPSQTVVTGVEFILPVSTLTGTQIQLISFSVVPTTGTWKISYNSVDTSDLNFDAVAVDIQVALRLISGLENVTVSGDYSVGFSVSMFGIQSPTLLSVSVLAPVNEVIIGDFSSPLVFENNLENFTVNETSPGDGSILYTIDPTDVKLTIPATSDVANGDHFIFQDDGGNWYYLILEIDGVQLIPAGGWIAGPDSTNFWIYVPILTRGTEADNTQALKDALDGNADFNINLTSSLNSTPGFDAVATVAIQSEGVPFSPLVQRADKLIDGPKQWTVKEVSDILDLDGAAMGFRVKVE